ncbi:MAG: Hint domain-containing protein, partial [Paracoccaceae bacterium]
TGEDLISLSTVSQLDAISLGDGLDTLTATAITVSGNIDAGLGVDSVTLSQSSVGGDLLLGDGNDVLSVSQSTVNGAIDAGIGNDALTLNSVVSLNAVSLGAGSDTLTATSISVSGNVDGGSGNTAMTITQSTISGDLNYTNGDATANATLVLNNSSVGGSVDDNVSSSVVNLSIIDSTVTGAFGGFGVRANNGVLASVKIDGSTITSGVVTGVGNDTISLTDNTIGGSIDAAGGNDRVYIDTENVIGGAVTGNGGTDTLILQGTSLGNDFSISLSAAATLTNATTTTLITEDNYSLVAAFSGGAITGTVKLGASGDTFAVNSFEKLERIVCFGRGTMIRVAGGAEAAVEALRIGDLVETLDAGPQPVRWIGMRRYHAADLAAAPHLRPIRIAEGALGRGLPERDLTVSPQHRMLVSGKIVQRMFAVDEVLVAAKQLLDLPGIDRLGDEAGVDYFHIMFDRHQVVFAQGAPSESFFVGREAVAALDAEARAEVLAVFPDLAGESVDACMPPVRLLVNGRRARSLAGRCVAQGHSLL